MNFSSPRLQLSPRFRLSLRAFLVGCAVVVSWPSSTSAIPPNQSGFPKAFTDGEQVRFSSVSVGDVDGDGLPDIVVGTRDGTVQAYKSTGAKLWSYDTGTAAIESKPAIADIDGDGSAEVVVGAGFSQVTNGGLYVLSHTGTLQCKFTTLDHNGNGFDDSVFSSPALADLDGDDGGKLEIVFGSWDQRIRAVNHDCTQDGLWTYFTGDTVWSSPAIADLDQDGGLDVVIGSDSNDSPGLGLVDGGVLYAFHADGTLRAGFPIQIDEVIQSSPSLGDLDGDGFLDIVVGTGNCWEDSVCSNGRTHAVDERVYAFDRDGTPLAGWPVALPTDEYAFASPALADLDGDGFLDVIINTIGKAGNEGQVYAFDGSGANLPGWPVQPVTPATCSTTVSFDTMASPIVADLEGDGGLEVILPSNRELVIWDEAGQQLTRDHSCPDPTDVYTAIATFGINSTAAVADLDGDGDLELIAGGASGGPTVGAIYAWDFTGTLGARPWPQFLQDPQNLSLSPGAIFTDGFESGNVSRWSASVP